MLPLNLSPEEKIEKYIRILINQLILRQNLLRLGPSEMDIKIKTQLELKRINETIEIVLELIKNEINTPTLYYFFYKKLAKIMKELNCSFSVLVEFLKQLPGQPEFQEIPEKDCKLPLKEVISNKSTKTFFVPCNPSAHLLTIFYNQPYLIEQFFNRGNLNSSFLFLIKNFANISLMNSNQ